MIDTPRKKSPRAPSLSLDEALDRAQKVYERERLHAAPIDVVAQNMGYKNASNGRALSTLASIRYFGLMDRPREGFLAVAREVEAYKFAPDESLKRSLLIGFLKRPALYNELLDKYASGLPSDANLRFDLIQRGFAPQAAEFTLAAFKRSVSFVGYFDIPEADYDDTESNGLSLDGATEEAEACDIAEQPEPVLPTKSQSRSAGQPEAGDADLDRIPVRLPGGRRAWLLIPAPFFNADRARLKAQIDLLLTKEEEDALDEL